MTPLPAHIHDLLASARLGESTAAEQETLALWLREHPEAERVVEQLRRLQEIPAPADVRRLELARHRIQQEIATQPAVRDTGAPRAAVERMTGVYLRRGRWSTFATACAVIVVGIVGGGLFHHVADPVRVASETRTERFATSVGRTETVRLRDGSQVILGPATTLQVESANDGDAMTATVAGHAQFYVTHRDRRAFKVRSGNATVQVLGTTFVVRHYAEDAQALVYVGDGRVSVSSAIDAGVTLSANMLGVVYDSGSVTVTPNVEADAITDWRSGRLVFQDAVARDIAAELGRAYGVDIRFADTVLAARRLTLSVFVTQRSADEVTARLATLLDARSVRTERGITIAPGKNDDRPKTTRHSLSTPDSHYGR
jgi:ferric-dicitrate binding protein FerR (iron transport regulator)